MNSVYKENVLNKLLVP